MNIVSALLLLYLSEEETLWLLITIVDEMCKVKQNQKIENRSITIARNLHNKLNIKKSVPISYNLQYL